MSCRLMSCRHVRFLRQGLSMSFIIGKIMIVMMDSTDFAQVFRWIVCDLILGRQIFVSQQKYSQQNYRLYQGNLQLRQTMTYIGLPHSKAAQPLMQCILLLYVHDSMSTNVLLYQCAFIFAAWVFYSLHGISRANPEYYSYTNWKSVIRLACSLFTLWQSINKQSCALAY